MSVDVQSIKKRTNESGQGNEIEGEDNDGVLGEQTAPKQE